MDVFGVLRSEFVNILNHVANKALYSLAILVVNHYEFRKVLYHIFQGTNSIIEPVNV
jgi:hypothetical protein